MIDKAFVYFYSIALIFIVGTHVRTTFGQTQTGDIVLYASQATVKVGGWATVSDSSASGGFTLTDSDAGAAKVQTPIANPTNYFEHTFSAESGRPYRLWIRLKAQNNSPYNDSVFAQFSNSVDRSGNAVYRIGTTSATAINLEDCFSCGLQGWGWQDNGWGAGAYGPEIYFKSSGVQTIRIQTREDGVSIDQVVLSSNNYLYSPPGALRNDTRILTASGSVSGTSFSQSTPPPQGSNIVIWAWNVSTLRGSWAKQSNSSAAGQTTLRQPDYGAAKISAPLASPTNYFDVNFNAVAGIPYRLWIRGRATNDYWGNDSVFAQFSGSVSSGGAAQYRVGTTSGLAINLEDCSGCGLQGWGWQDTGWGVGVLGPLVYFQTTGTQTLRVQGREDGLLIDQIVLSPSTYLSSSPGALRNDNVILPSTLGSSVPTNQGPQVSVSGSPLSGTSPLAVTFTQSSSDPDGYIAGYSWNFGDGTTSTAPNPTHTYQSAGTFIARLTVTDNSGATASATATINATSAAPAPTPPPPTSTARVKVLSWNIAFGKGTDGVTNYDRTVTSIANFNADLVALCEVPPDKVSLITSLVSQKTGRTWYSHFVPKGPGVAEGNLILSKYTLLSVGSRYLSYTRSVAQVRVSVGGKNINFFATHLDHTSSSLRYTQVGELTSWLSGFAEPRIVAGDFNGGPDTPEIIRMTGSYYDSWVEAMNRGTAVAYPDNPVWLHTRTRRGRIDYVFYSRGTTSLVNRGGQIPDVRDLSNTLVTILLGTLDDRGVRPSDHNPTIATLDIQ